MSWVVKHFDESSFLAKDEDGTLYFSDYRPVAQVFEDYEQAICARRKILNCGAFVPNEVRVVRRKS